MWAFLGLKVESCCVIRVRTCCDYVSSYLYIAQLLPQRHTRKYTHTNAQTHTLTLTRTKGWAPVGLDSNYCTADSLWLCTTPLKISFGFGVHVYHHPAVVTVAADDVEFCRLLLICVLCYISREMILLLDAIQDNTHAFNIITISPKFRGTTLHPVHVCLAISFSVFLSV